MYKLVIISAKDYNKGNFNLGKEYDVVYDYEEALGYMESIEEGLDDYTYCIVLDENNKEVKF